VAFIYISEYDVMPVLGGHSVPTGMEPAIATQRIAIGGSSEQSAAFNARTTFVRIHTDAICSILFGVSPTATTSTPRLGANATEFFGVVPGHKVANITNT